MQKFLFRPDYNFAPAMNPMEVQLSLIDPRPFRFDSQQALHFYNDHLGSSDPSMTPVITAEALSGAMLNGGCDAKQNADRLRATFPQAKILLVTREQKSLLRSLYKSMVAWGNTQGIDQLLEPVEYPGPRDFHLDFLRFHLLAQHYRRLYGAENLLVLPYEMFQQAPRQFLKQIFLHCGMDYESVLENHPPFGRRVNKTVSLSAITFQRWMNRMTGRFFPGTANPSGDEDRVKQINRRMRQFPAIPYLDARLEARFARIVEERTQGQFADSNRRLQALCGMDLVRYGYEMPARRGQNS